MLKIGTHDSVTSEKPLWWCWPLTLFARTQSKTIKEQYEAGCRLFDLRTKKILGKWRGAHGWWFTKKSLDDILKELNNYAKLDALCVYLTYEGKTKNTKEFLEKVKEWKKEYPNIIWGSICSKYGEKSSGIKVSYDILIKADKGAFPGEQAFLPLDGKHWQTYIPIPWLWKQFYFKKVEFNDNIYKYVDFL